MCIGTRVATTD